MGGTRYCNPDESVVPDLGCSKACAGCVGRVGGVAPSAWNCSSTVPRGSTPDEDDDELAPFGLVAGGSDGSSAGVCAGGNVMSGMVAGAAAVVAAFILASAACARIAARFPSASS